MTGRAALPRVIRNFVQDERGSIVIEFVIWLPLLLFWTVFTLATFLALENRYDSMQATFTISDIISKNKNEINRTRLDDYRTLAQQLLPNASGGSAMRISSIKFENGAYSVEWTECFGPIPALTDDKIPLSVIPLMEAGSRPVILTETYVPYLPLDVPYFTISDRWSPSSYTWRTAVVTRPRFSKLENNDADPANCDQGTGTAPSVQG